MTDLGRDDIDRRSGRRYQGSRTEPWHCYCLIQPRAASFSLALSACRSAFFSLAILRTIMPSLRCRFLVSLRFGEFAKVQHFICPPKKKKLTSSILRNSIQALTTDTDDHIVLLVVCEHNEALRCKPKLWRWFISIGFVLTSGVNVSQSPMSITKSDTAAFYFSRSLVTVDDRLPVGGVFPHTVWCVLSDSVGYSGVCGFWGWESINIIARVMGNI